MTTYYAVCDANGPISVRINAATKAEAIQAFEAANSREWIDSAMADAEQDLGIDGDGMGLSQFAAALEAAGATLVCDLEDGNVLGGWELWEVE